MTRAYALSDGNSFYCSCERVFDARLARLPVIVLSNNDGFCNRASAVKGCRAAAPAEGPHRVGSGPRPFDQMRTFRSNLSYVIVCKLNFKIRNCRRR